MIRLEQITKRYGDTLAVDQLSLEINEGEVCVLIGPSGCGKTTTLRMINRLIEPTAGQIFINGQDTSRIKVEKLRLSMGYAIQSVGLFPHMTVGENISVVPHLLHWEKDRIAARVIELLKLVGLKAEEYTGKYPGQLSGGEAQRIGVARALAVDPPILLMDEPFGAVDPLTRQRLQSQLVRIQQEIKKTIIMVTHDLDEAIRMADRIAIMESGRLVQYDTPEAILSAPINRFVRNFIGADRALKRISRISIQKYIRPAEFININTSPNQVMAEAKKYRWLWVIDDNRQLIGWVDRDSLPGAASIEEVMNREEAGEISLMDNATLRDALSQMLGLGFKYIPVIDDANQIIGELALEDIEEAMAGEEG
ncbi:MAG: ABC transporter ATP-binding protein [Dehalococcoidales bacterium]